MFFHCVICIVDHEPARLSVKNDGREAAGADGQQGGGAGRQVPLRHRYASQETYSISPALL